LSIYAQKTIFKILLYSFHVPYFLLLLNIMPKLRFLVAPLHWGLGHATRCVPIIEQLLAWEIEVILASDGAALALLRVDFPDCKYIELPSYNISYSSNNMTLNMARQLPRILCAMRLERLKLVNIIESEKINAVISDNRYGFFSKKVPTVFITHQLHLRVPSRILQAMARKINYKLISRYNFCWLPDVENALDSLSGELSTAANTPKCLRPKLRYIGSLSRLSLPKEEIKTGSKDFLKDTPFVLCLLSGPEPQRTKLETILRAEIMKINENRDCRDSIFAAYNFLLVSGLQGESGQWAQVSDNFYCASYLSAADLSELLPRAAVVVARSGYSTLMDCEAVGVRHLLLIPTTGQTEQEYLAARLAAQNRAAVAAQSNIDLVKNLALALACDTGFRSGKDGDNLALQAALRELLELVSGWLVVSAG
jgi:predicted glycosyltransferase